MPFSYLHAAILWGLIALIIPPIVHLLNRRRFEVVEWAAMQFLQITKKIRRRMAFEQLLLMFLRCTMIAVLVLAIASPVLDLGCVNRMPGGQWMARMAGQSNRDVVVIVDGSYSMDYNWDGQTADDAARKWAKDFLGDLIPGDRVAVLQAKQRTIPVVETLTPDLNDVRSRIETMPRPRGGVHWGLAVKKGLDILQIGQNPQKEIVILTDGQKQGWADAEALGRWEQVAQSFPVTGKIPRITVVNVVPGRPSDAPNWFVGPMRTNRAVATIGRDVRFKFDLQLAVPENHEEAEPKEGAKPADLPAPPRKVTFSIDGTEVGSKAPPKTGTPRIGMDFVHKFSTPGTHLVSAMIDQDALPGDNRRDFAVEVLPSIPVLLVDGEPRGGVRKRPSDFLRKALAPDNDPQPSFILRTISINEFGSQLLTSPLTRDPGSTPRVLILTNVPSISDEQQKSIEAFLHRGGGVLVALGDRCDPKSYNAILPREGKGWMPARLLQQTGDVNDLAKAPTPLESDMHHPAFELFKETQPGGFTTAYFPRYWLLDAGGPDSGTAVVKLNDRDKSPLLVERANVGKGRVILAAVALDNSLRTNLTDRAAYVPLCHELVYYLAAARSGSVNLPPGAHIIFRPSDGEPPCGVTIETPEGTPRRIEVANWPLDFEETGETGVYKLKTDSGKVNYYVVQPDSSESILKACEDKDRKGVQSFFPEGQFQYENDRGKIRESFQKSANPPQLWWIFLLLVLVLLLAELVFTRGVAKKSPPVTD